METIIFDQQLEQAVEALKQGEVVSFPTETVYGLGANALDESAVKKVFAVKGRPSDNPLIVHVYDFDQVQPFIQTKHPLAEKIVEQFWPGPLTLIFEIKPESLPKVVTGGLSTAAFRMPNHPVTLELLRQAQLPLVGPSANTSGKPSPTSSAHVYHDLKGKIKGIVEGGQSQIGVESTVLDLSNPNLPPMILRPGAITKEMLEATLGLEVLIDQHLVKESETPKAPGMKYKHYSPDTPVMMVAPKDLLHAVRHFGKENYRLGVMATPSQIALIKDQVQTCFAYEDEKVQSAAKGLFSGLRQLDEQSPKLDLILVVTFENKGLGMAYMNRLKKAAAQKIYQA